MSSFGRPREALNGLMAGRSLSGYIKSSGVVSFLRMSVRNDGGLLLCVAINSEGLRFHHFIALPKRCKEFKAEIAAVGQLYRMFLRAVNTISSCLV